MTLEERAEEYESKLYGEDCTVKSSCGRKKIYHTDVFYAYIAGAKDNNVLTKWHFVKDELPDEGTYLVIWQNEKGYKEVIILAFTEVEDENCCHWVDADYEWQDEYVKAWMELPPIPKER